MDVTVVVCTYNRCESLLKTLESLASSRVPEPTTWEVLVVDNNSSDQTAETVKGFCERYPNRFRYHFEARPGKSYAMNAGIQESRGSILALVDDDATVAPSWLERILAPFSDPVWSAAGGPVMLQWSCPRPRWLPSDRFALAPLAGFDPGREAGEIQELFGTNMVCRRSLFEKYGGFRTDLGPSANPKTPRVNDDSEFIRRILNGGERIFYEPSAVVFHPVPANRVQKAHFLAWWFDKGRADVIMLGVPPDAKWLLCGIPMRFFRRLINWTVRWMTAIGPAKRFSNRLKVQWLAGMIFECFQSNSAALPKERMA